MITLTLYSNRGILLKWAGYSRVKYKEWQVEESTLKEERERIGMLEVAFIGQLWWLLSYPWFVNAHFPPTPHGRDLSSSVLLLWSLRARTWPWKQKLHLCDLITTQRTHFLKAHFGDSDFNPLNFPKGLKYSVQSRRPHCKGDTQVEC